MKRFLSLTFVVSLFLSTVSCLSAQQVDSVLIHSDKMNKDIKSMIVLPADYSNAKEYPVVYLLHGYGGDEHAWMNVRPDMADLATKYDVIIVCPDGQNSWYFDSPIDNTIGYETFISKEVPAYIDANYSTIKSPKGRAITGLSMGGHGALFNAIRHQDVFGAAGSTSGGVDYSSFPNSWQINKVFGDYYENTDLWKNNTVLSQVDKITPNLAIIIDCGDADFFFKVNKKLHDELTYRNIKHEYTVRPGTHNRDYWARSLPHHLEFFNQYFRGVTTAK